MKLGLPGLKLPKSKVTQIIPLPDLSEFSSTKKSDNDPYLKFYQYIESKASKPAKREGKFDVTQVCITQNTDTELRNIVDKWANLQLRGRTKQSKDKSKSFHHFAYGAVVVEGDHFEDGKAYLREV